MKIKVSDYIADFLADNGIKDVFTVTGGGAMHLNDSFGHSGRLKCIYNHHEQACAMAAEAYTRLSGDLALVCVTSGPGGTNALTGVLGGWLDSIPMFIISGQVKRETTVWASEAPVRQLGDQEYNITAAVKHMTKYACMITDEKEISYHLEKALYLAKNKRGGPVWLDIPLDIQSAVIETESLLHFDKAELKEEKGTELTTQLLRDILNKIKTSKQPVIIAGSGIRLGDAHNEFIELINKLQIPVVTAWNAHDNLWDSHSLYAGRPGTLGTRGGNFIMENSDLILSLGCRLNIRQISYNYKSFSSNAYKIIVDIDQAELDKPTLKPDLKICTDVKDFIKGILNEPYTFNNERHVEWLRWCRNTNSRYPAVRDIYRETRSPVNPYVFVEKLFKQLNENETIITGNGSACVCTFQAAYIKRGQRLFTNSGCASMGYGLPAALGGCIANSGNRVICLEGDGSIMMNLQELATIAGNKLNIKIFVLNNNGYHSIRQTQNNIFKNKLIGVNDQNGVYFPKFREVARAFELPFYIADNHDDLESTINAALEIKGPVLCEIVLDENQNFEPKLSSKVLDGGTIVSPDIDDMFPFLSREEYLSNKR